MSITSHERGLSRRAFLGLGATAAVAAGAGLAGCAPQTNSGSASTSTNSSNATASSGTPNFMTAPDPIDDADIAETIEADIVIVGAGLSGICAARSAVENGATNIVVVEKATTWQYRSNQIGCIGGKIKKTSASTSTRTRWSARS